MSLINELISKNESSEQNIFIKIYHEYHDNIIWHSANKFEVKKTLTEFEENYLKRSNLTINPIAVRLYARLGWFYNVNKDFFDMKKAHDFLTIGVNNEKDIWYSKWYLNNLGVVYDQNRYGNFSIKESNEMAFKFYKKAAELGLHHAYGNLGKS